MGLLVAVVGSLWRVNDVVVGDSSLITSLVVLI